MHNSGLTDKVFYFTSYIGKKNSALYYFYLSAPIVPFIFEKDLVWTVPYSITELKSSKILYLNELLLLYKNYLSANGIMKISQSDNDDKHFSIESNIRIEGEGLFKYYNENSKGIIFTKNQSIFTAKIKNQEKL